MKQEEAVRSFLKNRMMIDEKEVSESTLNMLIDVDSAIVNLIKNGTFTTYEQFIIYMISRGLTVTDIAAILTVSRKTAHVAIKDICKAISDELGEGYFENFFA